jgi:hypothetical protein
MIIVLPIELSEDFLAKFIVGDEVTSFMSADKGVQFGVNFDIVFHESCSEIVHICGTFGVFGDDFCHFLLESIA